MIIVLSEENVFFTPPATQEGNCTYWRTVALVPDRSDVCLSFDQIPSVER